MHCLWEIIDNAVDEALAGFCDTYRVILHADGSSRSATTAAAFPVDIEPVPGSPGSRWSTPSCTPGEVRRRQPTPPPVACTVWAPRSSTPCPRGLDVEVDRGGKTYAMSFRRGEPGVFADGEAGPSPDAPFTRVRRGHAGAARSSARSRRGVTGTRMRYWPDRQIFLQGRPASTSRPDRPRPPDLLPRARARTRRARRARHRTRTGPRRSSNTTAASPSSPSSWPRPAGHRCHGACRAAGTSPRHVPVLDAQGAYDARPMSSATCPSTSPMRWGTGYDTRCRAPSSTSSPRPRAAPTSLGSSRPCSRSSAATGAQRAPPQGRHRQGRQGRHPRRA
jgi:DNA gyrase subunit B